jgi:hypothetical protein
MRTFLVGRPLKRKKLAGRRSGSLGAYLCWCEFHRTETRVSNDDHGVVLPFAFRDVCWAVLDLGWLRAEKLNDDDPWSLKQQQLAWNPISRGSELRDREQGVWSTSSCPVSAMVFRSRKSFRRSSIVAVGFFAVFGSVPSSPFLGLGFVSIPAFFANTFLPHHDFDRFVFTSNRHQYRRQLYTH